MFDFLKKKPEKPAPAARPAAASPSSGWSPDELARAYTVNAEQKAARLEAERAEGREAMKGTLGGSVFARSFGSLFARHPKLDEDLLDDIEAALVGADVGVAATTDIVERLRRRMKAREFADVAALVRALRADLLAILKPVA